MRALEHCADYKRAEVSCIGCPIYGRCFDEANLLEKAALALLREKNALIAKHEAYIDTLNDDKANLVEQIEKKDAEIERLNNTLADALVRAEVAKVETITEFAERLKAEAVEVDVSMGYGNECWQKAVTEWEIDQIAKEMKGVENGESDI
jgi:NurA-like 5'-3' nuclease